MLKKIIKFGVTGGLGTITNLSLFFVFSDLIGLNPTFVSVGCFLVACTQNYIINHLWTFKVQNKEQGLSFALWAKFLLASLFGLAINLTVLNLLIRSFSWQYKVIPQGIGILVAMLFNFIASNFFVFKKADKTAR